jgi:hypothetical protein
VKQDREAGVISTHVLHFLSSTLLLTHLTNLVLHYLVHQQYPASEQSSNMTKQNNDLSTFHADSSSLSSRSSNSASSPSAASSSRTSAPIIDYNSNHNALSNLVSMGALLQAAWVHEWQTQGNELTYHSLLLQTPSCDQKQTQDRVLEILFEVEALLSDDLFPTTTSSYTVTKD